MSEDHASHFCNASQRMCIFDRDDACCVPLYNTITRSLFTFSSHSLLLFNEIYETRPRRYFCNFLEELNRIGNIRVKCKIHTIINGQFV